MPGCPWGGQLCQSQGEPSHLLALGVRTKSDKSSLGHLQGDQARGGTGPPEVMSAPPKFTFRDAQSGEHTCAPKTQASSQTHAPPHETTHLCHAKKASAWLP